MKSQLPRKTVYRLSLYSRCLERTEAKTISSESLAQLAGVKPTQLRKDLAYCGHAGKRGLGYDVAQLRALLAETLGTSRLQPVVLVGTGHLGRALLRYREGFDKEGFEIAAAFDIKPMKTPPKGITVPIFPMTQIGSFIADRGVRMAVLCVPALAAPEVWNLLVTCGIQGILNFAPIILQTPPQVAVNDVNLAIELKNLSYLIQ